MSESGQPAGGLWAPLALDELTRLLSPARAPWWVACGVAIDLFMGRRGHGDLDVEILRRDLSRVARAMEGWSLCPRGRNRPRIGLAEGRREFGPGGVAGGLPNCRLEGLRSRAPAPDKLFGNTPWLEGMT